MLTEPEQRGAVARPGWRARWAAPEEVRAGLLIIAALVVLGALLGIVWEVWSPPGPAGLIVPGGAIEADESEAFIAADGRFAVLVFVVGLAAGLLAWFLRRRRGPAVAAALAIGGVAGAALTNLVGHLLRGGSASGAAYTVVRHLPLSVHATGLLFLEAAVAVLVYLLCTAFAAADDLGRPEPGAGRAVSGSVGVGGELEDAGGDADAPGGLQQRDLPPEQPDREP